MRSKPKPVSIDTNFELIAWFRSVHRAGRLAAERADGWRRLDFLKLDSIAAVMAGEPNSHLMRSLDSLRSQLY
jgi:hypothetical protein